MRAVVWLVAPGAGWNRRLSYLLRSKCEPGIGECAEGILGLPFGASLSYRAPERSAIPWVKGELKQRGL
jgi:hypothetical protein